MIGGVLSRYFGQRFLKTVLACFGGVFFLIFTIDLVETLRRSGETPGANGLLMAWLSLLHTPIVAEQALPFAVLLGSMIAFLNLSRRLELVVARAAGVSVWQFLAPALFVAALIGTVEVTAYNPLSTAMKRQAEAIEAKMFGAGAAAGGGGIWLRQKSVDGQSIVHSDGRGAIDDTYLRMQAFNFDADGAFIQRVDAERAILRDGYWEFHNVTVVSPGFDTQTANIYLLATTLTPLEVSQAFVAPETVSFWRLNGLAEQVERAGLDATAYRLRYQQLIALPALLVAMVLVASCFSLRLFRMGGVQKMVSGGVAAGFVLYVSTKIVGDLGGVGVVSPAVAGWAPAIVGCLFGVLRASASGGWLMDRSIIHPDQSGRRGRLSARLAAAFCLWAAVVFMGAILSFATAAHAQSTAPLPPGQHPAKPAAPAASKDATPKNPDKLYIDADQLIYDNDHNIVTAAGGVVLYYKGRVLQADKVVYDRNAKRVTAEGRAKFTDEKGNISYAPRFDLTDDFANGFADSVQELAANKTRFTASRVERSAGSVTVLQNGVYTACEPCKAHPELPPEWQVRAAKIIENQETHTVYFENAWLDVFGAPVIYMPYMSAPDPTVTRQSGFLAPAYTNSENLGFGVSVPYFFNLAPNYDLTLTPTYYTRQGPALDAVWRQRLDNGQYSVTLSGVDQMDPNAFASPPYDAGNLKFRGSAQSEGKFYLNDKWTVGWDVTLMTDRYYLNDYKLITIDPSQFFFQDIVSSAYLRGQADRGFFDLSGYYFQATTAYLDSRQDPIATPVFDYHRTFAIDPNWSNGIGGEASVTLNAANVDRTEALYQSVGLQQFDPTYNLYSICTTYTPGTTSNNCLLRGIAGDYARATADLSWQRKFTDPIGEVWTPFVLARVSGEATNLNTTDNFTYGTYTLSNSSQPAFFNGASSGSAATGMPGVGLEYRYPFVSNSVIGQQVIEPIAQIIVRPNEVIPRLQPNEDAQSLVFDDTNLFAWDKYSGFDRTEGGTRLNYGLQYTDNFADGGHANFVGGQSIQLAGQNSYTIADASNTGLDSGLDKMYSNFVFGETLQPFSAPVTLASKQQINSSNGSLARFDGIIASNFAGWSTSLDYAHYAAQPLIGWEYPREGLVANTSYKVAEGVSINGGVTLDMSRHYYDVPGENTPRLFPTGYNFGLSYATSCTTFKVLYSNAVSDPLSTTVGTPPPVTRDQTFLFQITLRTLGEFKASTGIVN